MRCKSCGGSGYVGGEFVFGYKDCGCGWIFGRYYEIPESGEGRFEEGEEVSEEEEVFV